jgi:hypothetical protein
VCDGWCVCRDGMPLVALYVAQDGGRWRWCWQEESLEADALDEGELMEEAMRS